MSGERALTFAHSLAIIIPVETAGGLGVVVTCNFPKVEITGSNPAARSFVKDGTRKTV